MRDLTLQRRVIELQSRGVNVLDPAQVYIGPDVSLERIMPEAVLYPGTRLMGSRTFLAPRATVGSEGPATVANSVLGHEAEIASGYVANSVLLTGARLGSNAHVRTGTLLEEYASTAHAVGLKQSILMAYVTVGSLVNFCDALVSGGRSRAQHSEIGSGFIHFNYAPHGEQGHKATPTLIGDVERGVFLREDRIFLGGLSGIVGPQKVGFGAFTAAGQVIRQEVEEGKIFSSIGRSLNKVFIWKKRNFAPEKIARNIFFIQQLFALKAWYSYVRLARLQNFDEQCTERIIVNEAISTIQDCITERTTRLNTLLQSLGQAHLTFAVDFGQCPLPVLPTPQSLQHIDWVKALSENDVRAGRAWLRRVALSAAPGLA